MVPERGAGGDVEAADGASIPAVDGDPAPGRARIAHPLCKAGQPCPLHRWSAPHFRAARRGRLAQTGIEAQAGDDGEVRREVAQQRDGREAAVGHRDDAPPGQPARDLQQRLAAPVRELLVALALLGRVPLGGRQDGQEGQAPDAAGPGNGREQHDAEPAQTAGLDEMAMAGADRVTVDPARRDPRAPAPLDGIIEADHHRAVRDEGGDQPQQEPMREHQGPWLSTRWYTAKPATSPRPMRRSAAATVRRPGASRVPPTSTSTWRQAAAVKWHRKGRIQPSSTSGTTLGAMAHRLRPGPPRAGTPQGAREGRHGRQPR